MSIFKADDFAERRKAAAAAAAAKLEKFRAKPAPDDAAVLAREAERKAIAEARTIRQAAKDQQKQEQVARQVAEAAQIAADQAIKQVELAAAKAADEVLLKAKQNEMASRVMVDEAERKIKRDARYAARKSGKK